MHNLPPLNALKAFEASARLQSFTKAAQELNVTRAAVSQQVKSLEQYLNATLFERSGTQLLLTQAACEYLPVVSHLFASLTSTTQHLFSRQRQQQLVLHVAHSFCLQWLMPRLADFQRQYPNVSYKVSTTASTMPNTSDIADIEIINGYGQSSGNNAIGIPSAIQLTQEHWVVVASPAFLRRHAVNSLAELAQAPKLCTSGYQETWQTWLSYQGYHDKTTRVIGEFEHSLLAIEAAVNQLGVLVVRDLLVNDHLQQGELVRIGDWQMPSKGAHFMYLRAAHKPYVKDFAEWLQGCFA
ncbi:LysR substrate-binding domain-containing protein [Vibrio taketomensis]|uniref:LysR substrate-binding domain-containing protein n=1 Tax=Vibrio taketomensis TaxID=2572923 RepID=UPI00138A25F4|nr:LysR substrate-binding domain-containing protein [Vibrio taketomensis]